MKKIACIISVSVIPLQLIAQPELKTKSISVFKDGKSFVVKEGKVSATDKIYTLSEIPPALFGTFWFTGITSDISRVVSKTDLVDENTQRLAITFSELLSLNEGKPITVTTNDGKIYSGKVEDFDIPANTGTISPLETERSFIPQMPAVVMLKMDNKWISFEPSAIKSIEFAEKPERVLKSVNKVGKQQIKVHFLQGGQQGLNMMYLQNGISWMPVYKLELLSDTEARLKLQAEVINDVEDIRNTDINFVVGVPNFQYANQAATLVSYVNQLRNIYPEANFSNYVQSRGTANYDLADAVVTTNSNVAASNAEDLYFYSIKNADLEKGSRAHYPLFTLPIKIRHLYECSLSAITDENYYRSEDNFSFGTKASSPVFHVIEVANDTNTPFTTGAVMVTDGAGNPLAQDELKYTAKGLKSCVKLTHAPDVRVEEKEKIIDTKTAVKNRNGYSYNLVTIQNEVKIINTKNKSIDMSLNKTLLGKCLNATITYDIQSRVSSGNFNPSETLKFSASIPANGTEKFTYTYEVYVRE